MDGIRVTMDLGNGKNPEIIVGASSALLKGFDQLVKMLPIEAAALVAPEVDVLQAQGGVIKLVIQVNEFRSSDVVPIKKHFNSEVSCEYVVKLLECYIQHQTVSLDLLKIDPKEFEPALEEISKEYLEEIRNFFMRLHKHVGHVPIRISANDIYCDIPQGTSPFWKKIEKIEPHMTLAELERQADVFDVCLRVVDAGNRKCWTGTVNDDKIWKLEFTGKALAVHLAAISDTKLEIWGVFRRGKLLILDILDIKYPEGMDVDSPEAAQLALEFEQ
ncbi:hypothetical protein C2E25_11330 [Geothermobacter hydrogeniphilus]|uniref:Uncharacterized protein n=1 Tax=Geothermobacter hydrogeniphilus TaxID=1969733 RepID=A0A2K2H8T6_9BACT|nr:hypothetical protein [Geothermobacter hydrogeniphilus]PNU19687.1 hypothetical protein C2E25_11330 [Geothermobacter hydrogeniphilus]